MKEKYQNIKPDFFSSLLRLNGISPDDFKGFVFNPGMKFRDSEKWWGEGGSRISPHEGVDILLYRDGSGNTARLMPGTLVPAAFDGEVALVTGDLLGKTLFVRHGPGEGKDILYSIYAHTLPLGSALPGNRVKGGEAIAEISALPQGNYRIFPHLHLSMAFIHRDFLLDAFSWEKIGSLGAVRLLDPLEFITPV